MEDMFIQHGATCLPDYKVSIRTPQQRSVSIY